MTFPGSKGSILGRVWDGDAFLEFLITSSSMKLYDIPRITDYSNWITNVVLSSFLDYYIKTTPVTGRGSL
jgi:hypothetical protein